MNKFILVRHGETEWNTIRRIQGGASDTPLSEVGKHQAECLGLRLKNEKIEAIYSSPLQRALHTAQAIAHHHQLEVLTLPELKEINVGGLEGVLSAELKLRFDEMVCQDYHQQGLIKLPGGESLEDVQQRAWTVIRNIATKHSDSTVVVVSHYFVIMSLVCQVLGLPLTKIIHLRLSTGTLTTFTLDGNDRTQLEMFNNICY